MGVKQSKAAGAGDSAAVPLSNESRRKRFEDALIESDHRQRDSTASADEPSMEEQHPRRAKRARVVQPSSTPTAPAASGTMILPVSVLSNTDIVPTCDVDLPLSNKIVELPLSNKVAGLDSKLNFTIWYDCNCDIANDQTPDQNEKEILYEKQSQKTKAQFFEETSSIVSLSPVSAVREREVSVAPSQAVSFDDFTTTVIEKLDNTTSNDNARTELSFKMAPCEMADTVTSNSNIHVTCGHFDQPKDTRPDRMPLRRRKSKVQATRRSTRKKAPRIIFSCS